MLVQSLAKNFGTVTAMVPPFLNIVDLAHRLVGPKPMQFLSDQWMKLPGHIMPAWNPYMPRVRLPALAASRAWQPPLMQGILVRPACGWRVRASLPWRACKAADAVRALLQGASKVQQPKAPLAKHEGVERKVPPTPLACHGLPDSARLGGPLGCQPGCRPGLTTGPVVM